MIKNREEFERVQDKFQYVLETEDLYQSAQSYNDGIKFFEQILKEGASSDLKIDVGLGLTYINRTRPTITTEYSIEQLDDIFARIKGNAELEIKTQIVKGELLLTRSRAYDSARKIFKKLYLSLKNTNHHFLFGLVAKALGATYMLLGENEKSEEAYQDALVTFRRFGHRIFYAYSLNNYAILKKRMGQYDESEKLLKQSVRAFSNLGMIAGRLNALNNLGIVNVKTGNWTASRVYFDQARLLLQLITERSDNHDGKSGGDIVIWCDINTEHLLLLQRDFESARTRLEGLLEKYERFDTTHRMQALAHEFLGELHTETGDYEKAEKHLDKAYDVTMQVLPKSDVMTEIKRRQADLENRKGEFGRAKHHALDCIKLSKEISDKHELGGALRILGEVYQGTGKTGKAVACFEAGIEILKGIHECYELMRTHISYGAFLIGRNAADAEIHLMDARQLCKKLELDFFMTKTNILLARNAANSENFTEAREYLLKAEKAYDTLQACDQKQIKTQLKRANEEIDRKILQKSMTAAEEIKTICRVYEEARFPMEDIVPDLAYRVAQSVGAESLFLIRRSGRGYVVPLTYNIAVREAKDIVRRLDTSSKQPLLAIESDPRIFDIYHTGKTLVCVPGRSKNGYVLCTQIAEQKMIAPRNLEFLFASAEAMERLAEEHYTERQTVSDEFITENLGSRKIVKHPRGPFKKILTIDPDMIKLIRIAERASLSAAPILLEGETGVGKELFARAIHDNSRRSDRPFIAINAGGMAVNLLESQLFGHVRGAYTDAVTDRIGLVEEARGGSIFFDEVGEMSEELQVKLLRLLENGEFRRLGENRVRISDVRMISATNLDLLKQVERGEFRKDLYYRIGAVKLTIPPLRFRSRDIELLIRHFLKECALRNLQSHRHFEIDVKAMEALELYDWPGNIRELQNEIMRIVSLIGENDVIRFGMLSEPIKVYLKKKNRKDGLLERSVERYERRLILDALNKNDWNRLRTAEEIGLPRTTLLAKMKRYNIAAR